MDSAESQQLLLKGLVTSSRRALGRVLSLKKDGEMNVSSKGPLLIHRHELAIFVVFGLAMVHKILQSPAAGKSPKSGPFESEEEVSVAL